MLVVKFYYPESAFITMAECPSSLIAVEHIVEESEVEKAIKK